MHSAGRCSRPLPIIAIAVDRGTPASLEVAYAVRRKSADSVTPFASQLRVIYRAGGHRFGSMKRVGSRATRQVFG